MAREVKYGQAYAKYVGSDGVTVATQTLAITSAIPKNAIITSTTVIAAGPPIKDIDVATLAIEM